MATFDSSRWTGLGTEDERLQSEYEAEQENSKMGGSSGAWHPGPAPGALPGNAGLGSTSNWSPGQAAYQQAVAQAQNPYINQGYGISNQAVSGNYTTANTVTWNNIPQAPGVYSVPPGGNITLATTATGHQHDRYIPLPGGCSTGTKYICTYSEYSGWNIKIETPDPANQPILNHTSFSLSEIEEAQQTIKDLELLHEH